jgi:hypothetical protein
MYTVILVSLFIIAIISTRQAAHIEQLRQKEPVQNMVRKYLEAKPPERRKRKQNENSNIRHNYFNIFS